MRWSIAFGWLCVAGLLRAEVPMDLDSPFVQTVLIQEKTGEITEKEVRKGQIKEEVIEFEKKRGWVTDSAEEPSAGGFAAPPASRGCL